MKRVRAEAGEGADVREASFGQDWRSKAVPGPSHDPLADIVNGRRRPQAPIIMSWWFQGSNACERGRPSMPPAHRLPCTTPHPVRLSAFASRGRSARTSSSYGSATFLPAVPQEVVSLR
jgi:hypothetical protein